MAVAVTCPRGHELDESAVYCTTCWVRVAPEDADEAARRRQRQRRVWFPLFGVGAVAMGVMLGGTLAVAGGVGQQAALIAEPAAPAVEPAAPAVEQAAEPAIVAEAAEPQAVALAPLAATIAGPAVTVCVPAGTSTVEVSTRSGDAGPWTPITAETAVGPQGSCGAGEAEASVTIVDVLADGTPVRILAFADDGSRLAKVERTAPLG